MEILRLLFFLFVACASHAWSDSVKHYDGSMGPRQAEFSLEWGENGAVKGSYFYTGDNRSQYKLIGSNKAEGVLELNVYSGDRLTARMSLQKKTKGNSISWDGVLKGTDGKILAVSFSRIPDAPTEQALDAADKSGNGEKVVKDPTNGALVWRPYSSNIQWTGGVNGSGFAEGKGTLVVFDRKGNRAAIFTGIMKDGHIVGDVTAKYPTSPDRAHYVGGFSNWSENGMGTMTYNDGKVVAGNWKNGELVAIKAAEAAVVSGQSGEPVPRSKGVNPAIEPPDPDSAADVLQKTYDKLKNSLQGEALQNLKVCQRAWIKYNEAALRISSSIWNKPNDSWEGADRFDALMAWHRTRELQLITDSLFGPKSDKPLIGDLDEQVSLMAGKLRQINANGNIKAADMTALKQYWDQSCQLAKLADPRNEPQNPTVRSLLALATKNFNEILNLWVVIPQEIVSANLPADKVVPPRAPTKTGIDGESGISKQGATGSVNSAGRTIPNTSPTGQHEDRDTAGATDGTNNGTMTENPVSNEVGNGGVADRSAPQKSPEQVPDAQFILAYLAVAFFVTIALIGVFMGVNEKITIYNGNWDFGLTCITVVSAIAAAVGFSNDNTPFTVLSIIVTCVALLMSFRESLMANDSALRASLAVPAKFILIVFITLCGFMALGGVRSGMDELKKGNKDKAAMQFAIAAVAALGARFFHRLIKKLIKERVSMRTQPLPIEK